VRHFDRLYADTSEGNYDYTHETVVWWLNRAFAGTATVLFFVAAVAL
jgi:hypothetical protein